MAALVDTNVLVYRFDPRDPSKQTAATGLLRGGIADGSVRVAHQAIVEFVAAATRPVAGGEPLLSVPEAVREAEELLVAASWMRELGVNPAGVEVALQLRRRLLELETLTERSLRRLLSELEPR